MSATIEFIFDFGNPNAYLAYRALPPILERTGARLAINPCLLGGIFKATGNKAPSIAYAAIKGKLEYEMLEFRRFIAKHRLAKFRFNPHFPVNTLMLMRGFVAAKEAGAEAAISRWALRECGRMASSSTTGTCSRAASTRRASTSASLLAAAETDPVKQKLADNTAAAVARGVFGIPTFLVGDELFFGKERLAAR